MPGRRRGRAAAQSSSDDDDAVIGSRGRKDASSPLRTPVKDVGERVLTAARNSFLRRKGSKKNVTATAEKPDLNASRKDRRDRRRSRRQKNTRGSGRNSVAEAKDLDVVDSSERNARQLRREQRRKRRNTPHFPNDGAFGLNLAKDAGSRSLNHSAATETTETTEVENIQWQHRINQGPSDSEDVSDDGGKHVLSDEEQRSKPKSPSIGGALRGGAWGMRQEVPASSNSTAGLKNIAVDTSQSPTRKGGRRQLSPVNMRRRVEDKKRRGQRKKEESSEESDNDTNSRQRARGRRAGRERPAREGRRGRGTSAKQRKPPSDSESSESSEEDPEEITGRRRGRGRFGRNRNRGRAQRSPEPFPTKPESDSDSSSSGRKNRSRTPSSPGSGSDADQGLHRTSHKSALVDTPAKGHSALKRGSPSHSPDVHNQLREQLQADGLGSHAPEGKVESVVSHRKRLIRAKEDGKPIRNVPVRAPGGVRSRSNSGCSVSSLSSGGSDESGHVAVLDGRFNDIDPAPTLKRVEHSPRLIGFAGSDSDPGVQEVTTGTPRAHTHHEHSDEKSDSDDGYEGKNDGRSHLDFTTSPSGRRAEPDVTPGDKGREVFKGAFQHSPPQNQRASPRKSPRAGVSGASGDYALSTGAGWEQKRRFLTAPIPANAGILQCKVVRSRKKDTFVLWLEKTRPGQGNTVEFLMVGKQRKGAKATLNFVISMDENDHSRHGRGCIGKLRANMRATEYTLFDSGLNPTLAGNRRKAASPSNKSQLREELCLIDFVKGSMGFARGPREITAFVPFVHKQTLETLRCRPVREADGLRSWAALGDGTNRTYKLMNKPPVWNEQVRKYILNFHGRVEVASVKNFQLVRTTDPENLVLQCGRSHDGEDGSSTFILDFGWPLSPIQAFAIGLAGMTA